MTTLSFKNSRGMALIIALLLLVVLTILGVASMSSVVMQERMAGNVNLQTWAFEAASAGVGDSLEFASPENWGENPDGTPRQCLRGSGGWINAPSAFIPLSVPNLPDGIEVGYTQQVGCFEPENAPPEWEDFDEVPLQVLVLNRGEVRRGAEVLARREVEIRVDRRGEADCLLTMGPLDLSGIDMGNSKQGIVDGGPGGCPIRTSDPATAEEMRRQLIGNGNNSLLGNYRPNPPGIHAAPLPGVWADPPNLARAVNAVKVGIRAEQLWDPSLSTGSPPPGIDCDNPPPGVDCDNWLDANPFLSCQGYFYTSTPATPPNDPFGLYYIADDLEAGGNEIVRGMVFVEGGMEFNGNATYRGDLIILGGLLDVRGFGNAGNTGSLQLHKLDTRLADNSLQPAYDPDTASFGLSSAFNVSGMGKASITADQCVALEARWAGVNQCLDELRDLSESGLYEVYRDLINGLSPAPSPPLAAVDFGDSDDVVRFPIPRCGASGNPRSVIASWREYIDRERWN